MQEPRKIIIEEDLYLNLRGVQYRLKKNREECIRLLKQVKEGYLNPEQKIDKCIELSTKDEIL